MKRTAIILAALMCMASRHPDRMIRADLEVNYSFNRGNLTGRDLTLTTGTAAGNAVVTAGNRYLTLDGTGDWVTTSDAAGLDVGRAFSVSFWVQPSSPGTGASRIPLARYAATGNKRSWVVSFRYADTPQRVLLACGSGTGATSIYYFNQTLPTTGWHHYVAVYDDAGGTANRWKLYCDGEAVSFSVDAGDMTGTPFATDIGVRIGNDNDGTAATAWKGDVDDVRLYNRALSAAEVAAIYSSGRE